MRNFGRLAVCFAVAAFLCLAQDVVSMVHGAVTKGDHSMKTVNQPAAGAVSIA